MRLEYDKISPTIFFRACIQAYLERDETFTEWYEDFLDSRKPHNKKQAKIRKSDIAKLENIQANFKLDERDSLSIFDILEKENPNL